MVKIMKVGKRAIHFFSERPIYIHLETISSFLNRESKLQERKQIYKMAMLHERLFPHLNFLSFFVSFHKI